MMPLWMFTLGGQLLLRGNVQVPYLNLTFSLIALTLPLGIGLVIQHKLPKVAAFLRSILRPCTVCVMVLTIGGGTYLSSYIFAHFTWKVVGAGLSVALGVYIKESNYNNVD